MFSPETFSRGLSGLDACRVGLAEKWRIYAIEAAGLAGFLFVVGVVDSVLFASESPVEPLIDSDVVKRVLVGLAAGLYLIALVYSPFGTASGAHINPSVTLGFLRLGKISGLDSAFYICAQFIGAVLGVALFAALMATWASDPAVNFIVTIPGAWGWWAAFVAEFAITFAMFLLILESTTSLRLRRYTGLFAGGLLMTLIIIESPISGTSLNPARSTGSAVFAVGWNSLPLYFIAPPLGAQIAVLTYRRLRRGRDVPCAKLNHHPPGDPRALRCHMKNCAHRDATGSRSDNVSAG